MHSSLNALHCSSASESLHPSFLIIAVRCSPLFALLTLANCIGLAGSTGTHTACGTVQGHPARTGAEIITLGDVGAAPGVQAVPGPNIPRTYSISVVLPNGEVALIGGAKNAVEFSDDTAILQAGVSRLCDCVHAYVFC